MHENVFPSTLKPYNVRIFLAAILFFLKCWEICTEAIEMPKPIRLAPGAPKTGQFFAVICILQFGSILGYFSTFS